MITVSKNNNVNRYSDADLAEFRQLIEKKIDQSRIDLSYLEDQMMDLSQSLDDNGNDLDENYAYADVEFLQGMILRQKKHLQDLENALVRIKTKSYGICTVTGELIDKRRLLAVPTTSKSIAAKMVPIDPVSPEDDDDDDEQEKKEQPATSPPKRVILTKVIRKPIKKDEEEEKKMDEGEDLEFDWEDEGINYDADDDDDVDVENLIDEIPDED